MAEHFPALNDKLTEFIQQQHLFFVGTAAADGTVNLSPKGMDSLRVINPNKVVWLNLTGSGNETAAHLLEVNRMTIMFCSFDKQPLILRLYGKAQAIYPRDAAWEEMAALFPTYTGARQFFDMDVELVQTSCGYAVPHYQLLSERQTLIKSAEKRGREGIEQYWVDHNQTSIDGKPTGI